MLESSLRSKKSSFEFPNWVDYRYVAEGRLTHDTCRMDKSNNLLTGQKRIVLAILQ